MNTGRLICINVLVNGRSKERAENSQSETARRESTRLH